MRLYRFGSNSLRPPEEEFDGYGAVIASGRWHIKGKRAVYASTCEPLALLEKLVHRGATSPLAYPLYIADIPDNLIEELPAGALPNDWRSIYPPASTQRTGNAWLISNAAVGLLVPSILISGTAPEIKNCLLNAAHPDFHQTAIVGPIQLAIDPRL